MLHRIHQPLVAFVSFCCLVLASGFAHGQEARQWRDLSGRFTVVGRLLEVRPDAVVIEDESGKKYSIQITRLSKEDQQFLSSGPNPFQVIEEPESFRVPGTVEWDDLDQFVSVATTTWEPPPVQENEWSDFVCRPASLQGKHNFHESVHPLVVNMACRKAVVGFTVAFAVPQTLSRLSVVDLETGRSIHSDTINANMRPLAILDDGESIVMVGNSDGRFDDLQTKSEIQVWRLDGKRIVPSPTWIPFPGEKQEWGKIVDAGVLRCEPLSKNRLAMISDAGHFVVWDLDDQKAVWHAKLSTRNFAFDVSMDRSRLALFDETTISILDPLTATPFGGRTLPTSTRVSWPHVRFSPGEDRILLSTLSEIQSIDVSSGQWAPSVSLASSASASQGFAVPDPDFVLLGKRNLFHLPTETVACDYQGIGSIWARSGICLVVVQSADSGIVMPLRFPHLAAETILERSQSDPKSFLLHPGVEVAIDVADVSEAYQEDVRDRLQSATEASGYVVVEDSPISVMASISEPKQEAVSFVARGSFIVNKYVSKVQLTWNEHVLWQREDSNVPPMMMSTGKQTLQEAVDEAGKAPNFEVFSSVRFPKFKDEPKGLPSQNVRSSHSLTTARVTVQGILGQ